jgi:hypothetical protein
MAVTTTVVSHPGRLEPDFVPSSVLVTSCTVEHGPGHDTVRVWNRGGLSGTLTVNRGDGVEIARRLLPNGDTMTK